ncbi:L-histidine N(alpha)-methyltransferase [Serratia nevei]|uniref:L-histidine N(alpha)-methyltransferase n=1 Tax=Serratia nevei TaxID=2703794 RepID=UPI00313B117C
MNSNQWKTQTISMQERPPQPMKNGNLTIVDSLIDEEYMQLLDAAWSKVGGYARDIVSKYDDNESAHSSRAQVLEWLQLASAREVPLNSPVLPSGPALSFLKLARDAYPSFLAGESNGTNLLFSGDGLQIWRGYYSSSNPLYAPINQAAATALVDRVKEGVPLRILEIGVGTGGATTTALNALEQVATAPVSYLATDISASLLRSTADKLNQRATGLIEFNFEPYDFNVEPTRKHVSTGGFDVVLAVNALHNAHNLPASLRMLSSLLNEGGVLITSESICGSGEQVHQEFFLNLLPLPDHRQGCSSRFLSSEDWQCALGNAGLKSDIAINSIGPELMLLATVSKI